MNLKSVDLNLLVSFDALVSECNVSRAAEKLGMTQSALSHALKRLRVTFGDPLMRRGPRGMEPTERALSLRQPVKDVLADIHSIVSTKIVFDPASDAADLQAVDERRHERRGAAADRAPPAPSRRPTSIFWSPPRGPRDACARIDDDEVEMAIGVFPHLPTGMLDRELYRDKLVCVADKNHPLLKRGRMDEEAYLACPHVTVAPNLDSRRPARRHLRRNGVRPARRRDGAALSRSAGADPRNRSRCQYAAASGRCAADLLGPGGVSGSGDGCGSRTCRSDRSGTAVTTATPDIAG